MLDDGELVTRDRAARELRRSTRTVNAAIADSGLKPVEAEPGRRELYKFGELKAAIEDRLQATADQTRNVSASAGLTAARQRFVEAKARAAEQEQRKREGELIEASEVRQWQLSVITIIRTRLLALPTKLAGRLGMASTLIERHEILKSEVYTMLRELAASGDAVIAHHEEAMKGALGTEQENA